MLSVDISPVSLTSLSPYTTWMHDGVVQCKKVGSTQRQTNSNWLNIVFPNYYYHLTEGGGGKGQGSKTKLQEHRKVIKNRVLSI